MSSTIPEINVIHEAVKAIGIKCNGGEITRANIADLVDGFITQACILNNYLIDTLPPTHEHERLAFADLLAGISDDIRDNGGKVKM